MSIFTFKKAWRFVTLSFLITSGFVSMSFFSGEAKKDYLIVRYDSSIKDYTPIVYETIQAAKKDKVKKIVFEKGTYHFYNDKAFEKFCFISNHDDGLKKTAFPLIDFNNLQIDGGESMFLFHGPMIPFIIENSSNVTLTGFSVDWERTFHSELEVVAVDGAAKTIDFKISEDYPYEIRDGNLVFIRKDYSHTLDNGIYWDPQTQAVAYNVRKSPSIRPYRGAFKGYDPNPEPLLYEPEIYNPSKVPAPLAVKAQELKPGLVRLSDVLGVLPQKGWIYICKGVNSENRMAPAIRVLNTKKLLVENVNIHHAGGMGIIVEKSTNIHLNSFNVKRTEGSKRMLSTTADATHFVNCRGEVKIENCVFENQLDDATNIHGTYMEVTRVVSNNTIEAKLGHFQQRGYDFAHTGDTLTIVDKASFLQKQNFVLKSMDKVNNKYYRFTFSGDISKMAKVGDLIDNVNWYPEVTIRNNRLVNNRARGFLIASPKKVLIEGNTFSNMMSAILMEASRLSWWYESGNPQDVTIRNNTFLDGTYGGADLALIEIHTQSPGIVKNIRILDNAFTSFSPRILNAEGVENLIFSGNTIKESKNYPRPEQVPAILRFPDSKGIVISDNKVTGFEGIPLIEPHQTISDLVFKGNRLNGKKLTN